MVHAPPTRQCAFGQTFRPASNNCTYILSDFLLGISLTFPLFSVNFSLAWAILLVIFYLLFSEIHIGCILQISSSIKTDDAGMV